MHHCSTTLQGLWLWVAMCTFPFAANLIALQQFRQAQVDEKLLWANAKRTHHEHAVGQQVCILGPGQPGNKKLT